ncbi:hypothetical protein JCM2811A_26840 [Methylorubrum rhodinum]
MRGTSRLRGPGYRPENFRCPQSGSIQRPLTPPIGKQKRYPALSLTILHAREPGVPKDRPPIDWRLITDLPVDSPEQAVEKLRWYARRWKIEVFHHILKTGCRAEDGLSRHRSPSACFRFGQSRLRQARRFASNQRRRPVCGSQLRYSKR